MIILFFKAGFIDTWGRGFQKIRDGFEADGILMLKVENFCGGVRVSIERTVFMKLSHVGSDVVSNVTSSVTSFVTSGKNHKTPSCRLAEEGRFDSGRQYKCRPLGDT